MRDRLIFSGRSWPGAKIVGRRPFMVEPSTGVKSADALFIELSGKGRRVDLEYADAWWRDFAEISYWQADRALAFVQRRGEPTGNVVEGGQLYTGLWTGIGDVLRHAATAFGPEDKDRISRFNGSSDWTAERDAPMWLRVDAMFRGNEPILRAQNIASFMVASAASSIRRKLPMRRCLFCRSWFTLHRAGAEFCSATCRTNHSHKRSVPYGLDEKDPNSEGNGPVGGAVARARPRRKADRPQTELRQPAGGENPRGKDGGGKGAPRGRRPR